VKKISFRLTVKTLSGNILTFKGVKEYSLKGGLIEFKNIKDNSIKSFPVNDVNIDEEVDPG